MGARRDLLFLGGLPRPQPPHGFHFAYEDLRPVQKFVVYPGEESSPIANGIEAIPLRNLPNKLMCRRGV